MVGNSKVTPTASRDDRYRARRVTTVMALMRCVLRPPALRVSRRAHSLSRTPTTPNGNPRVRLRRDLDRFSLCSIDLQFVDLRIVPNSDQQTKTSTSECPFDISSGRSKGKAEDRPWARLPQTVANPSWGSVQPPNDITHWR